MHRVKYAPFNQTLLPFQIRRHTTTPYILSLLYIPLNNNPNYITSKHQIVSPLKQSRSHFPGRFE